MTTAFVLSGGASLGAAQVGMLAALTEAGVVPDLIVGSSVGALNGAFMAGRPGPAGVAGLDALWRGLTRRSVFPSGPVTGLLGVLGRSNHLASDSGIRAILAEHLRFERLEDAAVPLHVAATDVLTGGEVLLSRGDATAALLASTAIPGVFPPVRVEGRLLMDGGVVDNAPVSHAVALGATTVWVLACGYACDLDEPPPSALGTALHGVTLAIQRRLATDVERHEGAVDLRVLPPLCPVRVSPADFSRAPALIEGAYRQAHRWLSAGPHPRTGQAATLVPHEHVGADIGVRSESRQRIGPA